MTPTTLRQLISAYNLSQRAAAKIVGVHNVTFRRWCTGARKIGPLAEAAIVAKLKEWSEKQ